MSLSDHIALGEILTSGQLAQRLAATGLTADAARQAISRSNDPAVWVLPLRLPRRARLFARRESGKKDAFYDNLAKVITPHRPGLARTIRALLKRRVLLKTDAQRLLAAPLRPKTSRTPTYDAEVAVLVALRLCDIEEKATAFERLTFHPLIGTKDSHQHARAERVRQMVNMRLTRILTDHFRKQGVISIAPVAPGSISSSNAGSPTVNRPARLDAAKRSGLLAIHLRQAYGKTALKTLAGMEHLLGVALTGDSLGNTRRDRLRHTSGRCRSIAGAPVRCRLARARS